MSLSRIGNAILQALNLAAESFWPRPVIDPAEYLERLRFWPEEESE